MSMDPPKVMLEASFLRAVVSPDHPRHTECVEAYRTLVRRFEAQEVLLVAVGDHLRDIDLPAPTTSQRVSWFLHRPRVGVFAPVDPLYVGFQHRRAAAATPVDDPEVTITLVMCDRYKVRRLATINTEYERFDLELLPEPVG